MQHIFVTKRKVRLESEYPQRKIKIQVRDLVARYKNKYVPAK
jgi:hypothetical protein